jgi:hypothetical protein
MDIGQRTGHPFSASKSTNRARQADFMFGHLFPWVTLLPPAYFNILIGDYWAAQSYCGQDTK